ncbi:MAG: DNA-deoxyinosine glycosylase [Lysobacterales bacterium]
MKKSQGFAAVARPDARVLVLGSMPGVASLEAGQYYAFPHNAFWKIMGDLFGAEPQLDYASRLQILHDNGIALWDVIRTCIRPGSLDSAIRDEGMQTNDFSGFFKQHPHIRQVYFNGQKAAGLFRKHVVPELSATYAYHVLPSTSPANAGKTYAAKLEAWSVLKHADPVATHGPASTRSPVR